MGIMRFIKKLIRNKQGSAAVEMAFVMPVFIIAGLGAADLGLYVQEEMEIKQSVRLGAQAALMGIQDTTALAQVIKDSVNRGEETATLFGDSKITTSVVRTCGCPGSAVVVSCTALCSDSSAPSIYFDMNAQSSFKGIFIIPNKTISSSMRVKTR